MHFLPNYKLVGFLQKKLFAERRFVFVDQKNGKEIESLDFEKMEQKKLELADFFHQDLN
jgi:hypothetical protein